MPQARRSGTSCVGHFHAPLTPVRTVRVGHDRRVGPVQPGTQGRLARYRGESTSTSLAFRSSNNQVGDGIAEMRSYEAARKAIKTVGFEVLHEEDLADRDDKVKWYSPHEGNIFKAQTMWDSAYS